MEVDQIQNHAKAEAKRWAAEAARVAAQLATYTDNTHHDAVRRYNARLEYALLLLRSEQCSAQIAELAGQ